MTDEFIAECSREAKAEVSSGGAMSPALVVELVSGGLDAFDQITDEWRQMLTHVPDDPPYWRPEWIRAALRARWPKAKVMVVTVRREGRLCAVLPLKLETGKFWRLPARKLSAPPTMWGVGIDLLCVADVDGAEAADAIWNFLKNLKGWDVLELPSVLQGAKIESLPEIARAEGYLTGNWEIPLIAFFAVPQGPDALKELGKYPRHPKLNSKVKNRESKLAALGTVRLTRTEKASPEDIQRFYEMESSGRKGQGSGAILSDPNRQQFFDEVIKEAQRFNYLCFYNLELDGRSIAAHIGFTYRGRYWAAKSAYDEKYRDYAPGHVIVKAILRDLVERGISEYVMGIREDWKMEWTEHTRARTFQCVFNRGVWPRTLYVCRFGLRRHKTRIEAVVRATRKVLDSFSWRR
jgi:CelD/BcsL family acetyltransferase involved in cellulose biosynthesis